MKKVSIIIPLYNVLEYAYASIASAVNQSYSEVEVVLVDDGSFDGTQRICEQFAVNSEKVVLVKKINGGLSSARNAGFDASSGEYILFLDGDDLLDLNAISDLMNIAEKEDSDLIVFPYARIEKQGSYIAKRSSEFERLTSQELLRRLLLLEGETGSACGKLFSRALLDEVRFPEGQLFEDFGIVASVLARSTRPCIASSPLYGYVVREGSITRVDSYGASHWTGMMASLEMTKRVIHAYASHLVEEYSCFELFCIMRLVGRSRISFVKEHYSWALGFSMRKRAVGVLFRRYVSAAWKLRCALYGASPRLYRNMYMLYDRAMS